MSYKSTRIPQRFWGHALDDYETPPGEEQARDAVKDYVANIESHLSDGIGMALTGSPGLGKTMLMSIIGMAAHDKGYSVFYMPMARYIRNLLNLIAWSGKEELEDEFATITRVMLKVRNKTQFLLLDDVGKEHQTHTRFTEDEFDYLVRQRYDLALPTIITSNVAVSEWSSRYTSAMEDFAHEAFPPYHFGESKSFRRSR